MSMKERVHQDFEAFFAWLRGRGVGDPYYYYAKETWDFVLFQRDWSAFQREQQEKARGEEQRATLIQALKDPASKGAILAGVLTWPKDQQDDLRMLLAPPGPVEENRQMAEPVGVPAS